MVVSLHIACQHGACLAVFDAPLLWRSPTLVHFVFIVPVATTPRRHPRGKNLNTTFALVGGLCLMVVAQFILFPLAFSFLASDPLSGTPVHQSLHDFQNNKQQNDAAAISTTTTTTKKKLRAVDPRTPDGTFNGAPIYLRQSPPATDDNLYSNVHCVGENYRPNAWQQRSCRYSLLCLDTSSHKFLTFQSPKEASLSEQLIQRQFFHSSTTLTRSPNSSNTVSLGGINQKWGHQSIPRLEWAPAVVAPANQTVAAAVQLYMLPDDVVLIPFHSLNGANPGHLVWDDFLPIYTLLRMFQLADRPLMLLRYVLNDGERGLWASCDLRREKTEACKHMMNKFLPLMLGAQHPYNLSTTQDFQFLPNVPGKSNLVCAKTGVAGIGSLTDHGVTKSHGWLETDYDMTHNHGRGSMLYDFRNFMLGNLGFPIQTASPTGPHKIVFSQMSSDIFNRALDFKKQIAIVKERIPSTVVEQYIFKEHSLHDQVQTAIDASIYVTLCGGGAVTAMFLPRGATVIVYYSEDGGAKDNRMTHKPALLDWDLLNSMSHLRVHWLPRNTRDSELDLNALVLLIQHELEFIESQTFL